MYSSSRNNNILPLLLNLFLFFFFNFQYLHLNCLYVFFICFQKIKEVLEIFVYHICSA